MSNEVTLYEANRSMGVFSSISAFENAQRMADPLVKSSMVPSDYRNNEANALIAIDVAQRTNSSPLMVMQNLHIINGKPSWSSQFIIAALNACGRFSPLQYEVEEIGTFQYKNKSLKNKRFVAFATDKNGTVLKGPEVTLRMAVREGWMEKKGSKWITMPDLMGRYRAAAFFGRLYAPDILMGMSSEEEIADIETAKDITPPDVPDLAPSKEDDVIDSDVLPPEPQTKTTRTRATKQQIEQARTDGSRAFHAGQGNEEYSDLCTTEALKKHFRDGFASAEKEAMESQTQTPEDDVPFETSETPSLAPEEDPDFNFGE